MDRIIHVGVRGISKSIAITSEALAARKEKKSTGTQQDDRRESGSDEEHDTDIIDEEWELDEAVTENLPDYEAVSSSDRHEVSSMNELSSNVSTKDLKPLPEPVILPQRRPGTRSRGFIRAYAPSLGDCVHLNQDTFLSFLNDFDKASKTSPIFDVINIACFGIGLVPSTICFAVSTSVGIANRVAQEVQGRYRTNKFLDDVNDTLFKPRGLYCMVMAYRPDLSDEAILRADLSDDVHGVSLQKVLGREDSGLKQKLARLRLHSGVVKHDVQIPTPAPLVYPALDRAIEAATSAPVAALPAQSDTSSEALATTSSSNSEVSTTVGQGSALTTKSNETKAKLTQMISSPAIQDYLDRRAQGEFIRANPNSKLAQTLPPQKQYVNRFADPDHPVNSGSIFGLLSGGSFDPIAQGRIRRANRRAKRRGEPSLTAEETHDAYMGREVRGKSMGTPSKKLPIVGKMLNMKNNILYLVVVNMPSDQEVRDVLGENLGE